MRRPMRWMVVCVAAVSLTAWPAWAEPEPGGGGGIRPADEGTGTPPAPEKPAPDDSSEGGDSGGGEKDKKDQKKAPSEGSGSSLFGQPMFLILIGMVVLMLVMSTMSRKKQTKQRQAMLESLKKGDKVTTIGGIVGTIIEVRDSEVTVKVDETNNIRVKFARWAVRGVGDEAKTERPEDRGK